MIINNQICALYRTSLTFNYNRNLDKNQILRFSYCSWIRDHKDIIITGSTGIGKSYLGSALGDLVCNHGNRVLYYLTSRLFANSKEAKLDGSYIKKLKKYTIQMPS
ncbi:MAG: ATP-binding protein [Spirochaetales bacterium]|nr:ATP-binding protein [Spirochaetales bacterium]